MNRINLFEVERQALNDLVKLVENRVATETACREKYEAAKLAANKDVTRARKTIAADRERDTQTVSTAWDEARKSIQARFTSEQEAADRLRDTTSRDSRDRAKADEEKTQTAYSDALWTADSLYEAAEKQADDQLDKLKRKAAAGLESIESIWDRSGPLLARGKQSRELLADVPAPGLKGGPLQRMESSITQGEEALASLQKLRSLRWTHISGLAWFFGFALISAIPIFVLDDQEMWIGIGAGVTVVGSVAGHLIVRSVARRRCRQIGERLAGSLAAATQAHADLLVKGDEDYKGQIQEARRFRDGSKIKAQDKYPPLLAKISNRCQSEIAAAADRHERDSERLRTWQHESLQKAERHFGGQLKGYNDRYDAQLAEAEALFERRKEDARNERNAAWNELARVWREGQDRLLDMLNRLKAAEAEHFLPWYAPFWERFASPDKIPEGIRFGSLGVDLAALPGGIPAEEDLAPTLPVKMELPAYLPFPQQGALVLKYQDQGRAFATQELQTVMLRFLTGVPGGKVRFTIIDPVGLGDNFAAFMHLADYDEQMVGARIWTEQGQIEKRLADITAHMENVIQKYLRNQYKSIEEYNNQAGEVAEPFRVVVVANFPTNFNLDAARRLVSIVQSGATCGVYTLVSVDTKATLPQGFNPADLEIGSIVLNWKNEAFQWRDPEFARFPLSLEAPPPADEVVRLVRIVGEAGKNANRIEVPFDFVAPTPAQVWKSDSRKFVAVPIGRAGATRQQLFSLGIGTAQHALVAGKTGSGKSTLMHALITNFGLYYTPDEIELYLIDFKKGVEFKAYVEGRMPHARVVAIESEREFGLSVLQRLDGIWRERGDRFRDAGANDVATYRRFLEEQAREEAASNGDSTDGKASSMVHPKTCPQILLIVDEFQEFFVEDDRVSQETALLMDRIVRQGRAFGMHIVLGSQTIGGAYSLARSTIDQMAVRVALQCSDTDAQLILNKDNTAARLLTRPGEAIYNDANGLVEGNDLFQVVWMSDTRRDEALQQIRDLANERGYGKLPMLVFEGNIAAEITANKQLMQRLAEPAWPAELRAVPTWLGDAIAIKDPTAAVFRSNSGSHVLIIGQSEEMALGILCGCLIGLTIQHDPSAKFLVLDSTQEDDPNWGTLARVASALPHQIEFVERTTFAQQMAALGTLVSSRLKNETDDRSARYLIVHGLQRYRDLRKGDDDFGFGRRGGAEKVVTPAEHFGTILRDGPTVGVHAMVWCDVLTNLNRAVDRQLMREFGMRVLFQMNANDSSTLIDNPMASKLGRNRGLFLTEESPSAEKFRPYGLPTDDFLKMVKERLQSRMPPPSNEVTPSQS